MAFDPTSATPVGEPIGGTTFDPSTATASTFDPNSAAPDLKSTVQGLADEHQDAISFSRAAVRHPLASDPEFQQHASDALIQKVSDNTTDPNAPSFIEGVGKGIGAVGSLVKGVGTLATRTPDMLLSAATGDMEGLKSKALRTGAEVQQGVNSGFENFGNIVPQLARTGEWAVRGITGTDTPHTKAQRLLDAAIEEHKAEKVAAGEAPGITGPGSLGTILPDAAKARSEDTNLTESQRSQAQTDPNVTQAISIAADPGNYIGGAALKSAMEIPAVARATSAVRNVAESAPGILRPVATTALKAGEGAAVGSLYMAPKAETTTAEDLGQAAGMGATLSTAHGAIEHGMATPAKPAPLDQVVQGLREKGASADVISDVIKNHPETVQKLANENYADLLGQIDQKKQSISAAEQHNIPTENLQKELTELTAKSNAEAPSDPNASNLRSGVGTALEKGGNFVANVTGNSAASAGHRAMWGVVHGMRHAVGAGVGGALGHLPGAMAGLAVEAAGAKAINWAANRAAGLGRSMRAGDAEGRVRGLMTPEAPEVTPIAPEAVPAVVPEDAPKFTNQLKPEDVWWNQPEKVAPEETKPGVISTTEVTEAPVKTAEPMPVQVRVTQQVDPSDLQMAQSGLQGLGKKATDAKALASTAVAALQERGLDLTPENIVKESLAPGSVKAVVREPLSPDAPAQVEPIAKGQLNPEMAQELPTILPPKPEGVVSTTEHPNGGFMYDKSLARSGIDPVANPEQARALFDQLVRDGVMDEDGFPTKPSTIPKAEVNDFNGDPFLQATEEIFNGTEKPESKFGNFMDKKRQSGAVDLSVFQDAATKIYEKAKDFATWSKEMLSQFGESIKDHLQNIWNNVTEAYQNSILSDETGTVGSITKAAKVADKLNNLGWALTQENIPDKTQKLSGLPDSDYKTKLEYHTSINKALTDPRTGSDRVADAINRHFEEIGLKTRVEPEKQTTGTSSFVNPETALEENNPSDTIRGFGTGELGQLKAELYGLAKSKLTSQNATAGYSATPDGTKFGSLFDYGRPLTVEDRQAISKQIINALDANGIKDGFGDFSTAAHKNGHAITHLGFDDRITPEIRDAVFDALHALQESSKKLNKNNELLSNSIGSAPSYKSETFYTDKNDYENRTTQIIDRIKELEGSLNRGRREATVAGAGSGASGASPTSPSGSPHLFDRLADLKSAIDSVNADFSARGLGDPKTEFKVTNLKPREDGDPAPYFKRYSDAVEEPPIGELSSLSGKKIGLNEADRQDASGKTMGGMQYPFLKSNTESTIKAADGKEYRPVWASQGTSMKNGMREKVLQRTDDGHVMMHIMGDNSHASNSQFFTDLLGKVASSKPTDAQLDAVHAVIGIGEKPTTQQAKYIKEISDAGTDSKKVAKVNEKYANEQWFKDSLDSFNKSKSYLELAKGQSFNGRSAAIEVLRKLDFTGVHVEDHLNTTRDFVNVRSGDGVGVVQMSKNPDLFAIWTGKTDIKPTADWTAAEKADYNSMTKAERSAREKLLTNGKFKPHPSYDWTILGPANGDNFILSQPVDPTKALSAEFPKQAQQDMFSEKAQTLRNPVSGESESAARARDIYAMKLGKGFSLRVPTATKAKPNLDPMNP